MGELVVIGYSGHAYVVIDAALTAGHKVKAYTEINKNVSNPYDLEYLGIECEDNLHIWTRRYEFILGIGDNRIREKVSIRIISNKGIIRSIIHPSAIIGSNVVIGNGSFVAAGVVVNPMVNIGKSTIINTGAIIEHECLIGDYSHIAPGAVLVGNVKVGTRTLIGANSIIKEGVEIGDDVIIGAGAVVLKSISSGCKIVGNPGRKI
jgi:sugar O-acyltransferase (sialic acid O-acetyltransferase NeuD family)